MTTEALPTLPFPFEPDSFGPAMQVLTEMQQRYVLLMIYYHQGGAGERAGGRAAAEAGYSVKTCDQISYNLQRNVKVQEAIHEEATRQLHSSVAIGLGVIMQIAMNPNHKDQLKAAKLLAEGGRLITPADQVHVVKHTISETEQIKAISVLSQKLGLDPQQLLGQYGVVIDAEFQDVTPASQPQAVRQPALQGPAPEVVEDDEFTVYPDA